MWELFLKVLDLGERKTVLPESKFINIGLLSRDSGYNACLRDCEWL
jgi:hypothetical protein